MPSTVTPAPTAISGFINLNKPATWTSHDCVARLRKLLNTKKIGHGGTLDPLATGVLPIAVGRATRLLQYLPARKAYRAVIRFGVTTTTDDLEGEILTQRDASHLRLADIEAILPQFVGSLSQTPPIYSAVQVQGKRLYEIARRGKTVEVPTRQVVVWKLTPVEWRTGQDAESRDSESQDSESKDVEKGLVQSRQLPELIIDVDCGPGTYIRALARDMGERLGTGATLAGLTRTHSNGFDLTESISLEALVQGIAEHTFVPHAAEDSVQHLPAIALSPALAHRWCMGQKLALTEPGIAGLSESQKLMQVLAPPWQPLRAIAADQRTFLGIAEIRALPRIDENGMALSELSNVLVPKMVFAAID